MLFQVTDCWQAIEMGRLGLRENVNNITSILTGGSLWLQALHWRTCGCVRRGEVMTLGSPRQKVWLHSHRLALPPLASTTIRTNGHKYCEPFTAVTFATRFVLKPLHATINFPIGFGSLLHSVSFEANARCSLAAGCSFPLGNDEPP